MFLEGAMEQELVIDGTLAQDATQAQQLWQVNANVEVRVDFG